MSHPDMPSGAGLRGRVVTMAEPGGVVAHLVSDRAMTTGRATGRYTALCGVVVLPGSLMEQATDRCCRGCVAVVARRVL